MSHLYFGKAVAQQDLYLKIQMREPDVKWPEIQGARMKRLSQRGLHINPFLQEADFQMFDIHPLPKRLKRKTLQHINVHFAASDTDAEHAELCPSESTEHCE